MTENRILGTMKQNSGGGGLGKFLGSLLGGGAGFLLGGPAGALKGAGLGGSAGGMIGGAVNPAEQKNMGVGTPTEAAMQTAPQKKSALDRLNSIMDIGQTVASIDLPESKGFDPLKETTTPLYRKYQNYGRRTV